MIARLRSTRLSAEEIRSNLKQWCTVRGTCDVVMLLDAPRPFQNCRAIPDKSVLLQYCDVADLFVKITPCLKLCQTTTYDAFLMLHQKAPCLGSNPYINARKCAGVLRKILEWFRDIAFYPAKKELAFRNLDPRETELVLGVCNQVAREDGSELTVSSGSCNTKIVPYNRSGSFSSSPGSPASRSADQLQQLWNELDELCGPGAVPLRNPVDEIDKLVPADPVDDIDKLFSELESMRPRIVGTTLQSTAARPRIAGERHVSSAFKTCSAAEMIEIGKVAATPLPSGSGQIQRTLTVNAKKKRGAAKKKAETGKKRLNRKQGQRRKHQKVTR